MSDQLTKMGAKSRKIEDIWFRYWTKSIKTLSAHHHCENRDLPPV